MKNTLFTIIYILALLTGSLKAQTIDLFTVAQVMNYTRPNHALKILINPGAPLFERKYQHRTPAMAQGLIDKQLTIKELLSIRPKPFGVP